MIYGTFLSPRDQIPCIYEDSFQSSVARSIGRFIFKNVHSYVRIAVVNNFEGTGISIEDLLIHFDPKMYFNASFFFCR